MEKENITKEQVLKQMQESISKNTELSKDLAKLEISEILNEEPNIKKELESKVNKNE